MSLINPAAAASVSPTANLFAHAHKKGAHADKDGTAGSATQGAATTQSLLSNLFDSAAQLIGISLAAPQNPASSANSALSAVAQGTQGNGIQSTPRIGANVNAMA